MTLPQTNNSRSTVLSLTEKITHSSPIIVKLGSAKVLLYEKAEANSLLTVSLSRFTYPSALETLVPQSTYHYSISAHSQVNFKLKFNNSNIGYVAKPQQRLARKL